MGRLALGKLLRKSKYVGCGINGTLCVPHQPRCFPPPYSCFAWHRHLLHGMVLCVCSDQHQVCKRFDERVDCFTCGFSFHGIRNLVSAFMGWDLCLTSLIEYTSVAWEKLCVGGIDESFVHIFH